MPRVGIVTDSTCDLGPEALAALDVRMVPLTVHIGDQHFADWIDLRPAEFYPMLAAAQDLPTTSQPSPADFTAAYQGLAAQGCTDIVVVTLSSALSGTFESASLAADEFAGSGQDRRREERVAGNGPHRKGGRRGARCRDGRSGGGGARTRGRRYDSAVLPARHARLPRQGRSRRQGHGTCCVTAQHQAGSRGQRRRHHRALQEGARTDPGHCRPREPCRGGLSAERQDAARAPACCQDRGRRGARELRCSQPAPTWRSSRTASSARSSVSIQGPALSASPTIRSGRTPWAE